MVDSAVDSAALLHVIDRQMMKQVIVDQLTRDVLWNSLLQRHYN